MPVSPVVTVSTRASSDALRISKTASESRSVLSAALTLTSSTPPSLAFQKVNVWTSPSLMRMLWGLPSRTNPSTVRVSLAVMVVPGVRPAMTARPSSPVV